MLDIGLVVSLYYSFTGYVASSAFSYYCNRTSNGERESNQQFSHFMNRARRPQLSAHWFRVLSTCRGSRSSSFPSDYVSLRAAVAVCHFQPFSLIFFSAEHSCLDRERSLQSRPTCIVCWLFFISFLMVMDGPSATHPTATIGGLWLFSVTIKTRHAVISIITCIIRSKYSVLPVVFCEREKKTIWKWSATVWYCVLRHFQRWDTIQKIILGDIARPLIVTSSHHIGWFITFLP